MNLVDFEPSCPKLGSKGYVYAPELRLAIRVAGVTSRPLLLRGAPGSGKTTLARDLASQLGASYYQQVVTSRTEARDLEWRFDAVRRLSDAQVGETLRERVACAQNYVEPQVLWWAFDPVSARARGQVPTVARSVAEWDSATTDPGEHFDLPADDKRPAMVLIDEIDKAEPEMANDLLEPFDKAGFTVAETAFPVGRRRSVILVVTTNEGRDLPDAFLRRCVVHRLKRPNEDRLLDIARSHFERIDEELTRALAKRLEALAGQARGLRLRQPGTAEFLDALQACVDLRVKVGSDDWERVTQLTMWKYGDPDETGQVDA